MQKQLTTLLFFSSFILVAVIGSRGLKAQRQNMALNQEPSNERVITRKTDFHPPIRITMVKAKERVIETGRAFTDSDDWFNGLELSIRNDSDKIVTFIGVDLTFRRAADLPAAWRLEYGVDPFRYNTAEAVPKSEAKPVLPGVTVPLSLSPRQANDLQVFLAGAGFRNNGNKLEVRIIKIGFSDGTTWNAGRFYRRDPNGYRGWSPMDGVPNNFPMQPRSSVQKREVFFVNARFSGYGRGLVESIYRLALAPRESRR